MKVNDILFEINNYWDVYTSDPYTEEEIEVPISDIRTISDIKFALHNSGGPEARGLVSHNRVIAWDSHKLVHSDVLEDLENAQKEYPEDAPPEEDWIGAVFFYDEGVAMAPQGRTGYDTNTQLNFVRNHPILKQIYGDPVPIVQPKNIK